MAPISSSSEATNAQTRLSSVKGHMEAHNPTVFHSDNVPQAPEDPLFGLMAAYRKDDFDKKVDLGIGAYRDNNAKPWVLPVVKEVLANSTREKKVLAFAVR
jgi:aspartate aminotransferase